jgi:thymidylate synthase ThyX
MGYSCKVLADSVSPDNVRLTTLEVTFPRIVLSEFNTHRTFSRSSASSRAIPVEKMLQRVIEDPFLPVWWGKNQKGMQAAEELSDETDSYEHGAVGHHPQGASSPRKRARREWLNARDRAVEAVQTLQKFDLHKQIANRLLEPWLWHTVIVTATEWDNFFALRCHKDAQPEMRRAAEIMRDARESSTPKSLGYEVWHMPLVDPSEVVTSWNTLPNWADYWKRVSVGRCTRVSYLTHDGRRDQDEDVALCERIRTAGHMSPFEHVARPMNKRERDETPEFEMTLRSGRIFRTRSRWISDCAAIDGDDVMKVRETHFLGNFDGWVQMRKELPNEAVFRG